MKNFIKQNLKYLIFILLTFIVSWISWGLQINQEEEIKYLMIIGAYGPFISFFLVTLFSKDRSYFLKNILKQLKRWNINWKWYIFALFSTAIIGLISIFISNLLNHSVKIQSIDPVFILIAFFYVLFTSVIGEEIGWRGFILPWINKKLGFTYGSIVLGIIWGIWHLPLFYISTDFHQSIPFVLFLLQTTFMSFIYSWIYKNTKSLIISHIFHTASNITVGILPIIPMLNGFNMYPLKLSVLFLGFISLFLAIKYKNTKDF